MKIKTFQIAASLVADITEIRECINKLNTTSPFAGIAFYFGEGDAKEFVFPPAGLGRQYVSEVKAMLQERLISLEAEFAALQDDMPQEVQFPPSSLEIAANAQQEGDEA